MKIALFPLVALMWSVFVPVPVQAQTNCSIINGAYYCNGAGGSYTCRRIGNQVFCN